MKLSKQQMYIGIGVAALVAIWYFRKDKKSIETSYTDEVGVRNAGGDGKFNWFAVKTADRQKANAAIQIGTKGLINGTTACTVSNLYTDEEDSNWSAFKCEELKKGSYDIPDPSRFEF